MSYRVAGSACPLCVAEGVVPARPVIANDEACVPHLLRARLCGREIEQASPVPDVSLATCWKHLARAHDGSGRVVRYRTIVADPPWDVGRGPEWASNGASRPLVYDTMTLDDIASLPVGDLAERGGAHLYVWTINAYIEQTYEIVRAWGFKPSTMLTWCKPPNGIGLGGAYSLTTEHVLFARRGTCRATERHDTTWFQWPRGAHSAKPDAFLDMVERVSPAPYAELFARRARLNWSYPIGDQSLGGIAA